MTLVVLLLRQFFVGVIAFVVGRAPCFCQIFLVWIANVVCDTYMYSVYLACLLAYIIDSEIIPRSRPVTFQLPPPHACARRLRVSARLILEIP